MDSKYLKEHYNYKMDFTGSKPDLSYQMGDGSWVTPSVYYSEVNPIHLDLCSECGSKFLKEMENVLESMKNS